MNLIRHCPIDLLRLNKPSYIQFMGVKRVSLILTNSSGLKLGEIHQIRNDIYHRIF